MLRPDSVKAEKSAERFFGALRAVFVGAKVEGESGYINLMRIKSRYYTEGISFIVGSFIVHRCLSQRLVSD